MQLTISRLIALCAAGLLLAAIALTTWMQVQISQLDVQGHELERLSGALESAQELRYNTAQIQQFYTDASLTQERQPQNEAQQHYSAALRLLDELGPLLPSLVNRLEALRSPLGQLNSAGEQMVRAYAEGKEAGDRSMGDFDQRASAVIGAFAALSEPLGKLYHQQLADTEALRETIKTSNLLAWGLVLVFMLGALWLIGVRVLPPVRHLTHALSALNDGSGDLRRSVKQDHDDEVGQVVAQFNIFVGDLRSKITTVAEVSTQLEHSAEQLVSDAGASEQSASDLQIEVEQVAAAVNQMASTVQDVASNAQASSVQTRDADTQAQAAIAVVNKTITDIRALAEEVGRAAQVIAELEGHSREIGGVLEVIRTIAEQTNLLALNAAIEAARAGEQGRGFAVVADEVRTLASRTQKSTQEINGMIERLQNSSQQAVKVMDDSRDFAERGVLQALSAGEALQRISSLVSSVSGMSLHIAEAANEQAVVTDEINRRISTVSVVAHTTVALAESTLSRGRASGEDAERLLQIVRQFKF
ncbi:MAG: methyl-accepting chemotaxis protein [Pseudomonas sp.]|nr:methyl-accepting chemotaxis protein [Pseudomonas sp.]